ncbi:uncharacterized protein (TIGR02588 family) [Azospirillum fermentarium]|uniref:hypothetical protein n=1 Tax=Azospirillum fermentarium TaxID=1233114 RepID=UPI002225EDB2|nr:hypothetical protein [Azospirillum fermentarium]MCW2247538.1 uncharacterized protein (TIGR02588 family) [Azospirillum fermentarium]
MAEDSGIPRTEWAAACAGGALLLAAVGYLVWNAALSADSPPDVAAAVVRVDRLDDGWRALVRADNHGGTTAAEVAVVAELSRPGQPPERVTITFDYIPADSRRTGGVFFRSDPAGGTLTVRAIGYRDP